MVFKGRSTDTFEIDDIEVYQLVKEGSLRSYPSGFWDGVTASKTAEKILKYSVSVSTNTLIILI